MVVGLVGPASWFCPRHQRTQIRRVILTVSCFMLLSRKRHVVLCAKLKPDKYWNEVYHKTVRIGNDEITIHVDLD